jgi:hypothetical protein
LFSTVVRKDSSRPFLCNLQILLGAKSAKCPNGLANLLQNLSSAFANVAMGMGGVVPEDVSHRRYQVTTMRQARHSGNYLKMVGPSGRFSNFPGLRVVLQFPGALLNPKPSRSYGNLLSVQDSRILVQWGNPDNCCILDFVYSQCIPNVSILTGYPVSAVQ